STSLIRVSSPCRLPGSSVRSRPGAVACHNMPGPDPRARIRPRHSRVTHASKEAELRRNTPYGVTLLMRVAQLPRLARVPPQLPNGADVYCAKLQVWAMYSEAIQMSSPTTAAAP